MTELYGFFRFNSYNSVISCHFRTLARTTPSFFASNCLFGYFASNCLFAYFVSNCLFAYFVSNCLFAYFASNCLLPC